MTVAVALPEPDLLVRNALIDPGDPRPAALAIRDGRILARGTDAELAACAGSSTAVVDVGGRRVIPGLIDSHAHIVRGGLTWEQEVEWGELPSLQEGLRRVQARAAAVGPGGPVSVVGGWHPGQFAEGRAPTRADLDRVCPDNPCYVQQLYDEAILNTPALHACGLTGAGGDPAGVEVERVDGEPTGRVRGFAAFRHCLAAMGSPSAAAQRASLRRFAEHLAHFGLTGAMDPGGLGFGLAEYDPLFDLWRAGELPLRLRLFLCASRVGDELAEIEELTRILPRGFGDDRLRVTGIGELVVYGCHDMEGLAPVTIDASSRRLLLEISRLVAGRGWPMQVHAILDESIGAVLDAWEAVDGEHPVGRLGFTLAHVEAIGERNIARARALGLGLAVQNRLMLRARDSAAQWGEERVRHGPPLGRLTELGLRMGAGTDGTRVTPINPWRSLWWFVTGQPLDGGPRRDALHRLERASALRLYTEGSAALSGEAARRGRLAPGYDADLCVLDADYFQIPEAAIPDVRSALTVTGGQVSHHDPAVEAFAALAARSPGSPISVGDRPTL